MRRSAKKYEQENRPIMGSSTAEALGPGSIYQIDATVADVYLVSQFNRNWIIGRPVVYGVIDVFSRLVTGIYIGLEGPSWVGAMMDWQMQQWIKCNFVRIMALRLVQKNGLLVIYLMPFWQIEES